MPSTSDDDLDIGSVWHWVALERRRAARAAAVAQRHEERLAVVSESGRAYHLRLANLHRQMEQRHLASARMQALHAVRLRRWAAHHSDEPGQLRPVFMAAVAAMLGTDSAVLTVFGKRQIQAMVAVSDATARAAHDLEFVLGEGPTTDVTASGKPIVVDGSALHDRWPHYGPAIAELGVRAIVATPLTVPAVRLGALCGYDSRSSLRESVTASVDRIADALTHTVLLTARAAAGDDDLPCLPLFEEADYQAVVHQAVGVVSGQSGCDVDDALALIRARAFADSQPIDVIAARIVDGTLRLC